MNPSSKFFAAPAHPRLPFTVAPVSQPEHFEQVLVLRHGAYSRHDYKNGLKQSMLAPDETDLNGASVTLVAVCKQSNQVLGTVRLTASIDMDIAWPAGTPDDECFHEPHTYIDRFAVAQGEHAQGVAEALIKGIYLWSLGRDSVWAVALALPLLARVYRRKGGMVIRAGGQRIEMDEYHDEPYVLLATRLTEVRGRLAQENPTYARDFFNRTHPDVTVNAFAAPWPKRAPVRPTLQLVANE